MSDLKKLFKRDKIFLLCLAGIVGLILVFGFFNIHRSLEEHREWQKALSAGANADLLTSWGHSFNDVWEQGVLDYDYLSMIEIIFIVIIGAQIIKWSRLEGKNGREFQNLLPVKSASHITFDLICGVLFFWVAVIFSGFLLTFLVRQSGFEYISKSYWDMWKELLREIVVFSFSYSLIVFARKITNQIYGMFFAVFVIWYTMMLIGLIVDQPIGFIWDWYTSERNGEYMILLLLTAVLVFLAYWCDKKRDIAGGGTFSFKTVHYLMLIAVCADMSYTFYDTGFIKGQILRMMVSILLAGGISVGINYLMKAKKI